MSWLVFLIPITGIVMGTMTFCVVVWMVLNHFAQSRDAAGLSAQEQNTLDRMMTLLEKMEGRIGTLEKILDADHPGVRPRD